MGNNPHPTMLAAVCDGPGEPLHLRRMPRPRPGPGQLLVKMESCGICHSDLHIRNGDEDLPDGLYPLILGHEGIGRVAEIGPGTDTGLKKGVRVGLPWLYGTCGACGPCHTDHESFCTDQQVRGIHHYGAFAEYALMNAQFAFEIPEEIHPIAGAPLLCAGLTAWSALKKTKIGPGSRVLIVGAGGLGQYAILIAKSYGAAVTVIDRDDGKLEEARSLGADAVVPAGPDAGAAVKEKGGADIVLNFAPTRAVWPTIEAAVNPMSEIVAVALVYEPVDLSMMWLIDGGHRLFGSSVGTRRETREFLAFAAKNPLPVTVEPVPLSVVNKALDRLQDGAVNGRLCIDFSLDCKGVA